MHTTVLIVARTIPNFRLFPEIPPTKADRAHSSTAKLFSAKWTTQFRRICLHTHVVNSYGTVHCNTSAPVWVLSNADGIKCRRDLTFRREMLQYVMLQYEGITSALTSTASGSSGGAESFTAGGADADPSTAVLFPLLLPTLSPLPFAESVSAPSAGAAAASAASVSLAMPRESSPSGATVMPKDPTPVPALGRGEKGMRGASDLPADAGAATLDRAPRGNWNAVACRARLKLWSRWWLRRESRNRAAVATVGNFEVGGGSAGNMRTLMCDFGRKNVKKKLLSSNLSRDSSHLNVMRMYYSSKLLIIIMRQAPRRKADDLLRCTSR